MRAPGDSRRAFLESLGVIGAGAVLAGSVETARGFAANDTITVGCLGTGGRCRTLMKSLVGVPGVRIVAVCDAWDVAMAEARKLADPQALATKHYREVLDRKDVDAVLIGSPDHWHVPMSVDACNAGKDVYVEKPLTHDMAEGKRRDHQTHRIAIGQARGTGRHAAAQHAPYPEGSRADQGRGGSARSSRIHLSWNRNGGSTRGSHRTSAWGSTRGRSPGRTSWATRASAGVRRVPLPQLALVLGFRRRNPHRPDGPLDRRRPLDVLDVDHPDQGHRDGQPFRQQEASGRPPT